MKALVRGDYQLCGVILGDQGVGHGVGEYSGLGVVNEYLYCLE
jgi:hypothetical protein